MATCRHKNECKNASGECSRLAHPMMSAKKNCYEATESPTPLGQTELALLAAESSKNLDFLNELRWRMNDGFTGDTGQRNYALKMVDDWIDELESS